MKHEFVVMTPKLEILFFDTTAKSVPGAQRN
jgi:hypothetical protein